jgi:hypothetical protein
LDFIKPTIALIQLELAWMEIAIFSFGMLLVRRDIKQLTGWSLFCAFVLVEICINIELGTILQPGFSAPIQQTGFQLYGMLNLASKESLQNPVVQDRGMIKSRHETDYLRR